MKDRRASARGKPGPVERSALDDLVHRLRGSAALLEIVSQHNLMPTKLQVALAVLIDSLGETAERASSLVEDVGIDLSAELGITTDDLATMHFAAATPPFQRRPDDRAAWRARADDAFDAWGEVEHILGTDDVTLETRFMANAPTYMTLVARLEALHAASQSETQLLEAALLRLAVVVARKERLDE